MIKQLSQRDRRWKNIKVGIGNLTIGQAGCAITCLAMLSGTTPIVVNNELKRVKGYAYTNLVIWTKLIKTILKLKFIKRVYKYNNAEVKKNLPCLVEVNAAKIGAVRHWVLFIGGYKMIDPWTGKIESTKKYPLTGYSIIKKIK